MHSACLLAALLAVPASAEPRFFKATGPESRDLLGKGRHVRARQLGFYDPGYNPEFGACGSGKTCGDACGSQFQACNASTTLSLFCYNPSAGQTCCGNGSGRACEAGYHCAWSYIDGRPYCCRDGQSDVDCLPPPPGPSSSSVPGSVSVTTATVVTTITIPGLTTTLPGTTLTLPGLTTTVTVDVSVPVETTETVTVSGGSGVETITVSGGNGVGTITVSGGGGATVTETVSGGEETIATTTTTTVIDDQTIVLTLTVYNGGPTPPGPTPTDCWTTAVWDGAKYLEVVVSGSVTSTVTGGATASPTKASFAPEGVNRRTWWALAPLGALLMLL